MRPTEEFVVGVVRDVQVRGEVHHEQANQKHVNNHQQRREVELLEFRVFFEPGNRQRHEQRKREKYHETCELAGASYKIWTAAMGRIGASAGKSLNSSA